MKVHFNGCLVFDRVEKIYEKKHILLNKINFYGKGLKFRYTKTLPVKKHINRFYIINPYFVSNSKYTILNSPYTR